ncbi:MAG: redox-regulated ATPase YchF [Anaerolineaceae bacterium]|nr:redox-regulated ATPase YchF [Anaerolineaceae bacterium]
MRLGIIGLPNSGKTTIFNALTGSDIETAAAAGGRFEVHTAVVNVPDQRVDKLSALYKPKKTTYTQVTYVDIAGLDKGVGEGGIKGQFRNELAQVDGFVHVVRAYQDDTVPHPYETVDPARDLEILDTEFLLTDLVSVETRLERIQSEMRIKGRNVSPAVSQENDLMQAIKAHLEEEKPLRDFDLTPDQEKSLRGYGFLTQKPVLVVLNMGETLQDPAELVSYSHQDARVVGLQGKIEAEIAQLDAEDADMFMEEYGISERGADKVIRLSYELMAIQSFFTVGEDEVRAWSVPIGATAPEAAGAIHSDLQKGFIRAEVMTTNDLLAAGSEAALKSTGKMRLEGKDYIVQDGDIVHIRFNV